MDVIGYCRVSTEDQSEHGVSLAAQRDKIARYAEMYDHTLLDVYVDDGLSGKAMANRPGVIRALDEACRRHCMLVVYSISRLGRNTPELIQASERLKKAGAQFASISEHIDTTTAAGRMFFNMMAVLAQFERETVVERTIMGMEHKRRRNEYLGNPPYGFQILQPPHLSANDKPPAVLAVNQDEIVGLRFILARLDRPVCYAGLARDLEAAGHKPRTGDRWDRGVLRRIVEFHRRESGRLLREAHALSIGGCAPGALDENAARRA